MSFTIQVKHSPSENV